MNYTPVIIIGAGRSGTNMLRDIITSIPKFETWDCDEINPIWRYGNRDFETDVLLPEHASEKTKKYIRKRFQQLQKSTKADFVVEKTCANSLRLGFVYEIFPEAKYIIINRDGRDVVPSAMKRWGSSFELKYTLKKLRYVPWIDFTYHVWKFGKNRIKKFFTKTESLSFWGPVYKGIDKDVANHSLMEVCAKQWQTCAEHTIKDRVSVPAENIFDVKYEEFVTNPVKAMEELASFFNITMTKEQVKDLVKNVSSRSIGTHKKSFSVEEQALLNTMLTETLVKLNYK
ncbi:sulfotransferase [uncultured Kordia sp.]|uniref:sulfotransferase family protein n=1 Tax=uncultured Kordia sp. TaxID=507699 RepID=UPI0026305729|nr:sulfotransferase [uncultured Kordia sp.]